MMKIYNSLRKLAIYHDTYERKELERIVQTRLQYIKFKLMRLDNYAEFIKGIKPIIELSMYLI